MNASCPKQAKKSAQTANETALSELKQIFQNVRTKADVLRALLHKEVLRRIPIEQAPSVSKEQAEKDFRRERVILNGVFFIPDKLDVLRCEAFALSLHNLVERLQHKETTPIHTPPSSSSRSNSISDTILQRGCRTSAGADSFFMVQKLLCVEGTFVTQKTSLRAEDPIIVDVFLMYDEQNLDLQQQYSVSGANNLHFAASSSGSTNSTVDHPSEASHNSSCHRFGATDGDRQDTIRPDLTTKCYEDESEKEINSNPEKVLIVEGNNEYAIGLQNNPDTDQLKSSLFARIEVKNFFSVYDISAMDELPVLSDSTPPGACMGSSSSSSLTLEQPAPWLEVETILIDESNFRTKEHWRRIQLIVTEMSTPPTPSSTAAVSPTSSVSASSRLP